MFRRSKGATVRFEVCTNGNLCNTIFGFFSNYIDESNFTTTNNSNRVVEAVKFHNQNISVVTDEDNNTNSTTYGGALGTGVYPNNVDKYFIVEIEMKPTGGARYKVYAMGETTPMSEEETYGNTLESVRFGIVSNNSNNKYVIINNVYVFDEAKNQPTLRTNNLNFKEFKKDFWRVFIDVRDRMTVSDGKTGGYHMLQHIYLNYLKRICGENNQYTYNKMLSYSQSMGDYWVRIIEQMVPATTLWTSGLKVENSVLHRDKFVYKCHNKNGVIITDALQASLTVNVTGYTGYQGAQINVGSRGVSGFPLGSSFGTATGTPVFTPGATNNFFNVTNLSETLSTYGWINNYNMV